MVMWFAYGEDLFRQLLNQPLRTPQSWEESFVRYGESPITPSSPSFGLGRITPLLGSLYAQQEVGLWSDNRPSLGHRSSGYAFYQLGLSVETPHAHFRIFGGPGIISDPDARLGGHLQFSEELEVGVRDGAAVTIGLFYKHIGSAGLHSPDAGRYFGGLKVGVLW
jgi:hypothetical protein